MSTLDQVELQRQQLEENVAKLRKYLQHWRTWDAEYEGLKEEVSGSNARSEEDCTRLSEQLEGELVNKEEIYNLFGVGKGPIREIAQVLGFITRRQDYVQRNITTLSKQLRTAEDEIERLDEEINRSDTDDTLAGPLTEIIEELDEEGNIISSKISQPESATDQILATLRKAGLSDLDPGEKESHGETTQVESSVPTAQFSGSGKDSHPTAKGKAKAVPELVSPTEEGATNENKKSGKFAEKVQGRIIPVMERPEPVVTNVKKPDPSLISGSFDSNDRVIELDDDDEIVGATPVIPGNESPEDAHLRREMLQYSLNEIGSVVAELDLEEDYSDFDDDEDIEFDDDDGSLSELSEEEDEHGRSLKRGVTSKYRKQMLELEEKLMARMIENVGPEPDEDNPEIDREDLRKLVIRDDEEKTPSQAEKSALSSSIAKDPAAKKKGVRFADALDVSEAPETTPQEPYTKKAKPLAPIIDNVLERRAPSAQAPKEGENKPAKVSRFKKNREDAPPAETEVSVIPQERPILSDTIVEKPAIFTSAPTPEAHEFDPEIQQRQLASEYYRMRNNMIRQQGGFKPTEEETDQPLMEEVDGKVKKVSRFKAARLR